MCRIEFERRAPRISKAIWKKFANILSEAVVQIM